jgi:hypothetical protein
MVLGWSKESRKMETKHSRPIRYMHYELPDMISCHFLYDTPRYTLVDITVLEAYRRVEVQRLDLYQLLEVDLYQLVVVHLYQLVVVQQQLVGLEVYLLEVYLLEVYLLEVYVPLGGVPLGSNPIHNGLYAAEVQRQARDAARRQQEQQEQGNPCMEH